MFFTALIGTYIILRVGSPPDGYSNIFPPATSLRGQEDARGLRILGAGNDPEKVIHLFAEKTGLDHHQAEELVHIKNAVVPGMTPARAEETKKEFELAGAQVELEPLRTYPWPLPYDRAINPLSIDLTALNTFFLICSSVTMVLALNAIQKGDKKRLSQYLFATVCIGALFVSIQVIEYSKFGGFPFYVGINADAHPAGVSADGFFRPSTSLFASCFYIMTGFHGAHVTGGVILLFCIWVASLRGRYNARSHSSVELAGLYWHFVDLVWIILFTVVYLI
jgi:heme/copper-type cytochrome/quinol oxidase subunit 3